MCLAYSTLSFTLFFLRMGHDDIFLAIKKENSSFFTVHRFPVRTLCCEPAYS